MVLSWQGVGGSGGLFYHDKALAPVALTIDDPLRPGANIGAGSFKMHLVRVRHSGSIVWPWMTMVEVGVGVDCLNGS